MKFQYIVFLFRSFFVCFSLRTFVLKMPKKIFSKIVKKETKTAGKTTKITSKVEVNVDSFDSTEMHVGNSGQSRDVDLSDHTTVRLSVGKHVPKPADVSPQDVAGNGTTAAPAVTIQLQNQTVIAAPAIAATGLQDIVLDSPLSGMGEVPGRF